MISQVSRTAKQDLDPGTGKVGSEIPFENKHNAPYLCHWCCRTRVLTSCTNDDYGGLSGNWWCDENVPTKEGEHVWEISLSYIWGCCTVGTGVEVRVES